MPIELEVQVDALPFQVIESYYRKRLAGTRTIYHSQRSCGHEEPVEDCRACKRSEYRKRLRVERFMVDTQHNHLTLEQFGAHMKRLRVAYDRSAKSTDFAGYVVGKMMCTRGAAEAVIRYYGIGD